MSYPSIFIILAVLLDQLSVDRKVGYLPHLWQYGYKVFTHHSHDITYLSVHTTITDCWASDNAMVWHTYAVCMCKLSKWVDECIFLCLNFIYYAYYYVSIWDYLYTLNEATTFIIFMLSVASVHRISCNGYARGGNFHETTCTIVIVHVTKKGVVQELCMCSRANKRTIE